MPFITAKDGARIFYKTGALDSQSYSPTVGRCPPTPGTGRCCSLAARISV
jgi:hypothetical protein